MLWPGEGEGLGGAAQAVIPARSNCLRSNRRPTRPLTTAHAIVDRTIAGSIHPVAVAIIVSMYACSPPFPVRYEA